MGLVTFLSTEGGGSLCGVSAAKVDHVWHGRQEPGHCGVQRCESIPVSLFSLSAIRCEDRYEDPMGKSCGCVKHRVVWCISVQVFDTVSQKTVF